MLGREGVVDEWRRYRGGGGDVLVCVNVDGTFSGHLIFRRWRSFRTGSGLLGLGY